MPRISYRTSLLEDGSPNPDVAEKTVLFSGEGLQPNSQVRISLIHITKQVPIIYETKHQVMCETHEEGDFECLLDIHNPAIQEFLPNLGAGGEWNDKAISWMQPIGNHHMLIEAF